MNATHAHSAHARFLESASAEAHMPRRSNDGIGLDQASGRRLADAVGSDTSVRDGHRRASASPINFVDNLLINGANLCVPLAERHPGQAQVLQGIAELARLTGGFHAFAAGPLVRACIQFGSIRDAYSARLHVLHLRNQLIGHVNTMNPTLISAGGGYKGIEAYVRKSDETGEHLEIAVIVEIPDRFNLQIIDTIVAKLAPLIEQLTNGARRGASVSDIADRQLLCAQVTFDPSSFSLAPTSGQALAERIIELHNFACITKERVSARNADILATANSVLAAIGSAADAAGSCRSAFTEHYGQDVPLAIWYRDHHGHLAGRISLPVLAERAGHGNAAEEASGQAAFASTAQREHLANRAATAIGLAQSLANLHAYAAEAIAQSDPGQHACDLAWLVGARGSEIVHVVKALLSAQTIRFDHAVAALDELRAR